MCKILIKIWTISSFEKMLTKSTIFQIINIELIASNILIEQFQFSKLK